MPKNHITAGPFAAIMLAGFVIAGGFLGYGLIGAIGSGSAIVAAGAGTALVGFVRSNRRRKFALEAARLAGEELESIKKVEQERAAILDMVSNRAPLERILSAIANLVPKTMPDSGSCIWLARDRELHLKSVANVDARLAKIFEAHPLRSPEAVEGEAPQPAVDLALDTFGVRAASTVTLKDSSGSTVGLFGLYHSTAGSQPSPELVAQLAQLASLAIDNRLVYERLQLQAHHDSLTGLPNRLLYQERLQHSINDTIRTGTAGAVIWVDLDRYKQINDMFGHRAGDELLCEVAARLKTALRPGDTLARVGGDEFTLLVHDIAGGTEEVCAIAEKIKAAVAVPMTVDGHDVSMTASCGISLYPQHGTEVSSLIRNADLAMYVAKKAGRNGVYVFDPALGKVAQRRLEVEGRLRHALERNELRLEYQPLISRRGHLMAAEALLRWTSDALGPVSPAEFIPIAEDTGLISDIGNFVIRTACRDGSFWRNQGFQDLRVAVNVSSLQLKNPDFAKTVENVLAETKYPASCLEIEVTETALMEKLDAVIDQVTTLRSAGVRFAIDDFGTGYSSLSQLRNLPVHSVKIDRSFIKTLEPQAAGSIMLVRGIVGLAHSLQLEVVAEGVETQEQLSILRTLGCDINQGFLLHRPMSAERLTSVLHSYRQAHDGPVKLSA